MAANETVTNPLTAAGMPCMTTKAYNNTYPAITPTRPELSLKGKHVVLTGAGSGIGRETAKAFAAAGPASILLLGGRREKLLAETAAAVTAEYKNVKVEYAAIDVTKASLVRDTVSSRVTTWDILVLNAAYVPAPATIEHADLDDWSTAWDINIKGSLQVIQTLLPKRSSNATIIGTASNIINIPAEWSQKLAPYTMTKIAFTKAFEIFAVEVPDVHWVTFHPGTVVTEMLDKSGLNQPAVPKDDPTLPAHTAVWLASKEARFLRGKYIWAHWDVEELKERADEIQKDPLLLTANTLGWPFSSSWGFAPKNESAV